MARCCSAGTGRALSSRYLLAPTILLIYTGWILSLHSVGVESAPVMNDNRDNWNSLDRAGNIDGTDKRDKLETELGSASSSPKGNGAQGAPPVLIVPEFILTSAAHKGNNSQYHLKANQTVVKGTDEDVVVPEIEYQPGLVIRCIGKGYPRPNMTWELDDGHLPQYVEKTGLKYSHSHEAHELATDNNRQSDEGEEEYWVDLRLPKLNNAFYGRLRCRAQNIYGNVTWEVELIHNANSSILMKLVRITFATIFILVVVLLCRLVVWLNTRYKEKLYERLPPQDLEIIKKFKKGLAPPTPSPSSSICQSKALGLGASCVGKIEITVTGDGSDAALMREGYRMVTDQSSTPDLQKRGMRGGSGGMATPTSCYSVHVLDAVNSWTNYVPYDDRLETSSRHFKVDLSALLENGDYGMVFAGKVRNDLTMEWFNVAVKSGRSERDDNFLLESILTELKILASLPKPHDNIVNLRGAYTKLLHKRQAYIFLDYCKLGNLASFIDLNRQYFQSPGCTQDLNGLPIIPSNNNSLSIMNSLDNDKGLVMTANSTSSDPNNEVAITIEERTKPQPFTLKEVVAWSYQISDGMTFLHKNRIHHGNLSTANVYLTEGLSVKIGNIGCPPVEESSECIDATTKKWLTVPNFGYEHFSKKSDVWDYGRVMWELFSLRGQQCPDKTTIINFLKNDFEGNQGSEDIEEEAGIEIPDYATPEIFELMLCCWTEDGTLVPEFDFLSKVLKQLSKEMFPAEGDNSSQSGTGANNSK